MRSKKKPCEKKRARWTYDEALGDVEALGWEAGEVDVGVAEVVEEVGVADQDGVSLWAEANAVEQLLRAPRQRVIRLQAAVLHSMESRITRDVADGGGEGGWVGSRV